MDNQEWLDSLKPGDEVAIQHVGFDTWYEFGRVVDRRTPTLIIVGGLRANNKGKEIGTSRPRYLVEPTDELKREAEEKRERRALIQLLRAVTWHSLPLEALREVSEIVKRYTKERGEG